MLLSLMLRKSMWSVESQGGWDGEKDFWHSPGDPLLLLASVLHIIFDFDESEIQISIKSLNGINTYSKIITKRDCEFGEEYCILSGLWMFRVHRP